MKKIQITFFTWSRCTTTVEVPDDYQVPSSLPFEFWEDLCERYPDQIEVDIMTDTFYGLPDHDEFQIEQMGLEYIDSIAIYNEDGSEVLTQGFEKTLYS
ncbi:MAG TPA: hypothetical protein PKJ71_06635 [Bacteroidales bacterium]|nr:hypothetical protein [Bacteroidales bacterium]